jgi:hypothetical protein
LDAALSLRTVSEGEAAMRKQSAEHDLVTIALALGVLAVLLDIILSVKTFW